MAELRPVEDQRRASAAQQAADLPARWAAQLRAKASEGAAGGSGGGRNSRGGGGRYRPTSSSTINTRAPSLLSLESTGQNGPASPTTTTHSSGYPSSSAPHQHQQHPPYRHSAAPAPSYHHQQQQHPSARSHASLPVFPSSNGSAPHHEHRGGRHRDQLERVYHEQRYDAEFDRGIGSSSISRGAAGGSAAAGSSSSHQASSSRLFNPDAPTQSSAERRRERELRGEEGGGGSSSSSRHKTRSKREPVEAGDLGRRGGGGREQDSRESLESEESGASGRPGSRSSKDGRQRRSRREEQGRSSRRGDDDGERIGGGSSTSLPSQVSSSRQLFDPRRDDPVRFAQSGSAPSNASKKNGDSRSFVSSTLSLGSAASVSDAASVGQEESTTTGGSGGRNEQPKRETENPVVAQLRRAYREITDLETKLQDENKAAMAAAARDDEVGQGLRIQGGGKRYDDEYWVKLAMGHKQLADAHYSFLQMALDPRLPASLHSLPHRYNIPTRLWQTAFHQLLERMRHAIVSTPPPSTSSASPANGSSPPANVLEHLIEFIQYAYGHYSQLFEDPSVAIFRAAWIEQLGDLARYRMAVAGLASRVSAAQQGHSHSHSNGGSLQLSHSPERQSRPAEAASIGVAALGDWDVEEQDSWRVIARDWYGQGVTETPGTGRLQHHLALLSKGDELKSLYHYVKSLTAAHPYLSARESILPLFEDEHQARRTQPDVTKAELFVHLHGMLFTKISLDDFDDVLARFMERLREESYLLGRLDGDWSALGSGAAAPFGDAEWFMLAVINISALLQYGVEDGVFRKHTTKETAQHSSHSRPAATSNGHKTRTPQAIMLNPSSLKRETTVDDGDDGDSLAADSTSPDVVMKLNTSTEDDPLVFRLAQRLAFNMLEMALIHPCRTVGDAKIVNPYIILILTFLANMAQHSPALRHLERSVPWAAITAFFNSLPTGVDVRMDVPTKLLGSPLPEDWCIRGMDWTGKSLFGRGYWRTKTGGANSPSSRRDEMAPPPINGPSPAAVESEMDALKFDLTILDEFGDSDAEESASSASAQLSTNRWRRVATLAAWLARSVPGLDYDNMATGGADSPRFIISGSLEAKLRRWRREDEEAKEAERASRASGWQREESGEDESEEDVSDEEEDDENDSPAVRELKARRRHLKSVIRQARQSTRDSPSSIRRLSSSKKQHKKFGNARQFLKVYPGYTTLVFDTNILLTSMKLFRELIEAETWTIIVPLAVITELDGLKKNAAPLGIAASEAIEYLESAIRTHARHLKVQTSRGNYLRDLSIRSESIDFSASAEGLDQGFSHDFARTMDDVILRAVAWQQEHFTSRLAIVNPKADRKAVPTDAAQVVLVTFDRNLRLKARARGLDAADESGMAMMLEDSQENG